MNIEELLKEYTDEFVRLWHEWDIDALGSFFKDDVVFETPFISMFYPHNKDGKLQGKENVLGYWKFLKASGYMKKFHMIEFKRSNHIVYTTFQIDQSDQKLFATYIYNEYGKISRLKFEYSE